MYQGKSISALDGLLLTTMRGLKAFWSGRWESNPRPKLGKLLYCHCTTPALLSGSLIIHNQTTARTDRLFSIFSSSFPGGAARTCWRILSPARAAVTTFRAEHTGVRIFFCGAQSPWQRGTTENGNLLLRQYYLLRETDASAHPQSEFNQDALRLNRRTRKILGFETPASKLRVNVGSNLSACSVY